MRYLWKLAPAWVLTACGGDVRNDSSALTTHATGGAAATTSAGGQGGVGSSSATGTCVPAVSIAESLRTCPGYTWELEPPPYLFQLLVDTSGTMTDPVPGMTLSKWEVVSAKLLDYLDSLRSNSVVGFLPFPNRMTTPNSGTVDLPVDTCVNIAQAVPPQPLNLPASPQRTILANAIASVVAQGGTPTADAYRYAVNQLMVPVLGNYLQLEPMIILITDGWPTIDSGCKGAGSLSVFIDPAPVYQAITDAWTNHSIKTLVIGLPNGSTDSAVISDPRPFMSEAARLGQTGLPGCSDTGNPIYCHFDLTNEPDLGAGLKKALQAPLEQIATLVSCTLTAPAPTDGQVFDPTLATLYMLDSVSAPTTVCTIPRLDSACTSDEGWYWEKSSSSIELCAKTCASLTQGQAYSMLLGCETDPIIQ